VRERERVNEVHIMNECFMERHLSCNDNKTVLKTII
jgi:hypothetical protein